MNRTKFSVMDASKAFKKSRTTIYEAIKSGELSRDSDGFIDLSELIRVYGNPIGVQSNARTEHIKRDPPVHVQSEIENVLKDQISLLKNQLELANQREKSLMQHIEDLTHRIEFKGVLQPSEHERNSESSTENTATPPMQKEKDDKSVSQQQNEKKRIAIPEYIEPEPEKRGFWSRFFKPYG